MKSLANIRIATLRTMQDRKVSKKRDMHSFTIGSFLSGYEQVLACPMEQPAETAFRFYMGNHFIQELEKQYDLDEQLPAAVVGLLDEHYYQTTLDAARMFYYIVHICIRESRHARIDNCDADEVYRRYEEISEAHAGIIGSPGEHAASRFLDNLSRNVKLLEVMKFLHSMFVRTEWEESYGGGAWGDVAQPVIELLEDTINLEILLDTGYTLAHNGGPIFNKGEFYFNYSSKFKKILDLQRAGMLPNWACHYGKDDNMYTRYWARLVPHVASEARWHAPVDWFKVGLLCPINGHKKYKQHKRVQIAAGNAPKNYASYYADAGYDMSEPPPESEFVAHEPSPPVLGVGDDYMDAVHQQARFDGAISKHCENTLPQGCALGRAIRKSVEDYDEDEQWHRLLAS